MVEAPGPLPGILHIRADRHHYQPGRREPIRWVVLHCTESAGDSTAWLSTDPNSAVSAHVLVRRDGTRVNLVDYQDTAWHVGVARPGFHNANSLGLELENASDGTVKEPYPAAQLNTAAHCLATWLFSWGLTWDEAVVCHRDVAIPPGRRRDPSNLDLGALRAATEAWLTFFATLDPRDHGRWII